MALVLTVQVRCERSVLGLAGGARWIRTFVDERRAECVWRSGQDSNPRHLVPKTKLLATQEP